MSNAEDKILDCYDLEIIAEDFSNWQLSKESGVSLNQCYLLLWYLFVGNVNPKIIQDIPLEVITKAKKYILGRKLYVLDSKRPEDIESNYSNLCRHIQLNKRVGPA